MENKNFTSALGRPIDPIHYPTNLAIIVFALAGGTFAGIIALLNQDTLTEAMYAGFTTGAAVFFGWMLTREIDPDNNGAAFVSAGIALAVSLFVAPADLLAMWVVSMILRLVNRTVGVPAMLFDTVVAVIVTMVAIYASAWMLGLLVAAGLLADSFLENPQPLHRFAAVLPVLGVVVYAATRGIDPLAALSPPALMLTGTISVLFLVMVTRVKEVTTRADAVPQTLNLRRVQAGMLLALMGAIALLWQGDAGVLAVAPLWASLLGVLIYRLFMPRMMSHKITSIGSTSIAQM